MVVTAHVHATVRHDDERHVRDEERRNGVDDEGSSPGVGLERALPPSKPLEVAVAENDDLPTGEVLAGGLPATESVASTAEVPGAHDRDAWYQGLPPTVAEASSSSCGWSGTDASRCPRVLSSSKWEVRPDPQPNPAGGHRQLCSAPVHRFLGHQGEMPPVPLLRSGPIRPGLRTGLTTERSTGARRSQTAQQTAERGATGPDPANTREGAIKPPWQPPRIDALDKLLAHVGRLEVLVGLAPPGAGCG